MTPYRVAHAPGPMTLGRDDEPIRPARFRAAASPRNAQTQRQSEPGRGALERLRAAAIVQPVERFVPPSRTYSLSRRGTRLQPMACLVAEGTGYSPPHESMPRDESCAPGAELRSIAGVFDGACLQRDACGRWTSQCGYDRRGLRRSR